MQRFLAFVSLAALASAAAASCAAGSSSQFPAGAGGSGGAASAGAPTGGQGGVTLAITGVGGGRPQKCDHAPDEDGDHDGWTGAQGDCNDCDPNINPGAIDVLPAKGQPAVDFDCDGKADAPPGPCDDGLAVDDPSAASAARALDLCQTATAGDRRWGVLEAAYVRADGTPAAPGLQAGLLDGFGPNVHVQKGQRLLALSSGHARLPGQAGACDGDSCADRTGVGAPPGFPQDVPDCMGAKTIADDVGLELRLRAPTNATGYGFLFKFNSFEYPHYVCSAFNDQFIALVDPAPKGAIHGNISFDSKKNPVSVNLAFFNVCDPGLLGTFAEDCKGMGGAWCPPTPSPYCPSGLAQLGGTGFDGTWASDLTAGGATSWLTTEAPVVGGTEVTVRFTIWDTGDQNLDSTVLLDDFHWKATGAAVSLGTTQLPQPK